MSLPTSPTNFDYTEKNNNDFYKIIDPINNTITTIPSSASGMHSTSPKLPQKNFFSTQTPILSSAPSTIAPPIANSINIDEKSLYNSDNHLINRKHSLNSKYNNYQNATLNGSNNLPLSVQTLPTNSIPIHYDVMPFGTYHNTLPYIQHQDLSGLSEKPQDDRNKLFTIYGNDTDNDKLSGLPQSTTGSLSSIITTSIASSEPDPGAKGGGGSGGSSGGGSGPDEGGNKSLKSSPKGSIAQEDDEKSALAHPGIKHEKWSTVLVQVSIPFFLAGIGTIAAGIILGRVEHWSVFKEVTELFILVPSLLGLKGNLDMCLASRLSTQVNLGNMNTRKEIVSMIIGNISLVQVQAIVASFLVAIFAFVVGSTLNGAFVFEHAMLLIASAMFTATSSCFVLDFVLVAVVILSKKFRLNPDNLATPLAASIGDVVSISILSLISSLLFRNLTTHFWVTFVVVACYIFLLPIWVFIVLKNKYTRPILKSGWVPVLVALCISGLGGLVLDAAVGIFKGFVVFQPIINGIGGNLVSVQASKISTMLHQSSIIGIVPPYTKICEYPWKALFKGVPYAQTARILIAMSIPGNILFIFVADLIHVGKSTITLAFVLSYLTASLLQVMLLLYIAHVIIHCMWKRKIDPDNSSIPYLTALGDLIGSTLLALAFLFLMAIGQEYGAELNEINAPN